MENKSGSRRSKRGEGMEEVTGELLESLLIHRLPRSVKSTERTPDLPRFPRTERAGDVSETRKMDGERVRELAIEGDVEKGLRSASTIVESDADDAISMRNRLPHKRLPYRCEL